MNAILIPVGSHGDVHPFLGLGQALRDRGHRVTVVTSVYFEPLVRRAGLDCVPIGTADDYLRALDDPDLWHPTRGFRVAARGAMIPGLKLIDSVLTERVVPGETVVVAAAMALAARCFQDRDGLPVVSVVLQPSLFRSLHRMPALGGLKLPTATPRALKRLFWWFSDWSMIDPELEPGLNAYRAGLGLPGVRHPMDSWWLSPTRILGMFPDWFAAPQPDWPPQLRLFGFPLFDERGATPMPRGLAEFLDAGDPPIVATPGSAMKHGHAFFEAVAGACAALGRRGILLTRYPDQLPATLPLGVAHFDYAPFSQLLPRAAALVHHGGIGTTAQGLAAGIPQVVMPLAHDQFDNAALLADLGVGRELRPKRFRAPALAALLGPLLDDPAVAARARELAARCRPDEALDAACRWIEAALTVA